MRAAVAVVVLLTGLDLWWNPPGTVEPSLLAFALLAVSAVALLTKPLPALLICAAAFTTWSLTGTRGELLFLPTAVALYGVAVSRRSPAITRTVIVGAVTVTWSGLLQWTADSYASAPMTAIAWPIVALLLGEVIRGRRELQHEQAAREARRIADERLRIAREVHDVVAHVMAGVTVQMGVAVAALDRRPETARAALRQARAASRDALTELRTAVALLRDGPDASAGPPPGLRGLADLLDGVRSPTLSVTFRNDVHDERLPAVTELTVHRIVQEALTNTVRHSGASHVTVTIRRHPKAFHLEVADNGTGCADPTATAGFGLRGMIERAASVGGTVGFGPAPGGGFRVHATLPVPADQGEGA